MSAEVESIDREYNKGSADLPPRGFDPELPYYYKGGDSCIICLGQGVSLVVQLFYLVYLNLLLPPRLRTNMQDATPTHYMTHQT